MRMAMADAHSTHMGIGFRHVSGHPDKIVPSLRDFPVAENLKKKDDLRADRGGSPQQL